MNIVIFVLTIILLSIAYTSTAKAESSCSSTLEFSKNSSIDNWGICYEEMLYSVAEPSDGRMKAVIVVDGRSIGDTLQWQQQKTTNEDIVFTAVYAPRQLWISRTIRVISDRKLIQELAITNSSSQALTGAWLGVEVGGSLNSSDPLVNTFADLVYGFNRAYVAGDDGNWDTFDESAHTRQFAITSRHKALVVDAPKSFDVRGTNPTHEVSGSAQQGPPLWIAGVNVSQLGPSETRKFEYRLSALPTETQALRAAGYGDLLFSELWAPLAVICRWVEGALTAMMKGVGSLGVAVILFAVAVRLMTSPVTMWAARRQREFEVIREEMLPVMAEVRAQYKGAEQSERLLEIYRAHGVNPFSGLKGSVGLLIQIPFLLAVFNVTTVSSVLNGESFLWISNLAQPDAAVMLPASFAAIGSHLNALPIILGMLYIYASGGIGVGTVASKWMSAAVSTLIVVVFYSFSAALVLYWLTLNLLQIGERLVYRNSRAVLSDVSGENR